MNKCIEVKKITPDEFLMWYMLDAGARLMRFLADRKTREGTFDDLCVVKVRYDDETDMLYLTHVVAGFVQMNKDMELAGCIVISLISLWMVVMR